MRGAGVASRCIHGACCVNISHLSRVKLVTILALVSFTGIAISSAYTDIEFFFYMAIFCSIFMGISQSVGECTVL